MFPESSCVKDQKVCRRFLGFGKPGRCAFYANLGSLEQFLFVEGRFLSSSYPVSQRVAEEEISLAKLEPRLHQWRASDSSTVFGAPN